MDTNSKPFLTINEQVNLLKKRKLNISDNQLDEAKNFFVE